MADLDSISEDIVAHADSYYASLLRNRNDNSLLDAANEAQSGDDPTRFAPFDLSTVYRQMATSTAGSGVQAARQDDDLSEGDSTDHMQQHGNTKKRKVPANMACAGGGRERGSDEEGHLDVLAAAAAATASPSLSPPPILPSASQGPRKGKISSSALAGLQHKELVRQRKRQLAAVLGALSLGDTFALDQALSTHIPFVSTMEGPEAYSDVRKARLSRRRGPRLARAARAQMVSSDKHTRAPFPAAQFAFAYPSASEYRICLSTLEFYLSLSM